MKKVANSSPVAIGNVALFFAGALCAGWVLSGITPARLSASGRPAPPLTPPPLAAQPFDLADVQLLDGPFKAAMETNAQYLLRLEPDRFLSGFRSVAGLPPNAPMYGGWESADQGAGRCLGHYLSAISQQYRATGDARFKERIDYIVAELARCQDAGGDGYVGALPNARDVFAKLKAGDARALMHSRVPWYVIHKLMAGLRDAAQLSGNTQAKAVLLRLADWTVSVTSRLDDTQFQTMLEQEHGGMQEVLADVYAMTLDRRYLDLATRFTHRKVIDALTRGEDHLAGLHANTQIPKVIGAARLYELTSDDKQRALAEYFWDMVVRHHTYVIGGNSSDEHFGAPDQLSSRLTATTAETCNTYNMLKLTRHLFAWTADAKYADYHERALYNHILASQEPGSGMFTYYVSLVPGGCRLYSTPYDSFWCCVGTGMENHTKYGDSIYFHHGAELFVNLFIPSVLDWKEKGLTVRQETDYPQSGKINFTFLARQPVECALNIRHPGWAAGRMSAEVNGEAIPLNGQPGSYEMIRRTWKDGDKLSMEIPLGLRTETMADDPSLMSILYGPLVLGGMLGEVSDANRRHKGPDAFPPKEELPPVPALSTGGRRVEDWVHPVEGNPLSFRIGAVGEPRGVTLVPFYRQASERYTVYWKAARQ